jgi:hypothetical protein
LLFVWKGIERYKLFATWRQVTMTAELDPWEHLITDWPTQAGC